MNTETTLLMGSPYNNEKRMIFGLNSREFYIPPNPNFPDYFFSRWRENFFKNAKNSKKSFTALIVVYSKSIVFA